MRRICCRHDNRCDCHNVDANRGRADHYDRANPNGRLAPNPYPRQRDFRYTRLNEPYRPVLELDELILQDLAIDPSTKVRTRLPHCSSR